MRFAAFQYRNDYSTTFRYIVVQVETRPRLHYHGYVEADCDLFIPHSSHEPLKPFLFCLAYRADFRRFITGT
jgi:hypothetical protein